MQLGNRVHFKPLRAKVKNMQVRVKENSFQFNEENFFQTHGTAMGTKMAVSFANIFMSEIETKSIQKSETKPREWKRFIDDVCSLWDCDTKEVDRFIKRANYFHPKFSMGFRYKFIAVDEECIVWRYRTRFRLSLPGAAHQIRLL